METCQFSKSATRICIEIGDKCLGSCLIIFLVIVAHSQHIQRFFRFIGSFQNGYQLIQQRS